MSALVSTVSVKMHDICKDWQHVIPHAGHHTTKCFRNSSAQRARRIPSENITNVTKLRVHVVTDRHQCSPYQSHNSARYILILGAAEVGCRLALWGTTPTDNNDKFSPSMALYGHRKMLHALSHHKISASIVMMRWAALISSNPMAFNALIAAPWYKRLAIRGVMEWQKLWQQ